MVSDPDIGDKRTIDIALTETGEQLIESCPIDLGTRKRLVDLPPEALNAVSTAVELFSEWGSVDEPEQRAFGYF